MLTGVRAGRGDLPGPSCCNRLVRRIGHILGPGTTPACQPEAHELEHVPRADFFHDARLVYFDGSRADPQLDGDLLRVQAARDPLEHLALAGCEPLVLAGVVAARVVARDPAFLALEGRLYRGEQLPGLERLLEKVDGIGAKRGASAGDVALRRDYYDRYADSPRPEPRLELQPALARKFEVEHEAACAILVDCHEERFRIGEERRPIALDAKAKRERIPHGRIVVHHVDGQVVSAHGRKRWNSVCSRGPVSSDPPCASAMARLTDSPRPIPMALPETKGSNRRSRVAAGIPGPLSATRMRTMPPSVFSATMRICPSRRVDETSDSTLFATRLRRTSSICSRSTRSGGRPPPFAT